MHCAETVLPDHGVRIVKGIGDAVMFTAPDAVTLAGAGVELIRACAASRAPELPAVRAGAAHGPVLPRYADYFGRTVNIASRLTGVAPPHHLLLLEPNPAPADAAWHKAGAKVLKRRRLRIRGIEERLQVLEFRFPPPARGG